MEEYEQDLVAAERTPGTIATYVGDVRRFIEWLNGAEVGQAARMRGARAVRRVARVTTPIARPIPPHDALRLLVAQSRAAGDPAQSGIRWPRDRWISAFPSFKNVIESWPTLLDRMAVRAIARSADASDQDAVAAFIAAMAWGFGSVGYGPHRSAQMLTRTMDASRLLREVAIVVRDRGALAGYVKLSSECRIQGLGPAFGTKYLAFCQPDGQEPTALIHDALVSAWLARHGRPDLTTTSWRPRVYGAYLEQMALWSLELRVLPERTEFLIFRSVSNERGNQWSG